MIYFFLAMKYVLVLALLIFLSVPALAKHLHKESVYQMHWCSANRGLTEYILDDKTRIDCLTQTHAIEFDFANKWAESIGQSLYYGLKTQRTPGIVLIIENPEKDGKYVKRLEQVANKFGITYWLMYSAELD